MVALSAEELLQVVVGRRQAGNLQVVEQAGAVAVGDLEEAVDGIAQAAAGIPALAPVVEQAGVASLAAIGRTPGCVLQDAGRGMDPPEAPPDHSARVRSRPLASRERSFFNSARRSPPFARSDQGWPRSPPAGRAAASLERAVVGQGA